MRERDGVLAAGKLAALEGAQAVDLDREQRFVGHAVDAALENRPVLEYDYQAIEVDVTGLGAVGGIALSVEAGDVVEMGGAPGARFVDYGDRQAPIPHRPIGLIGRMHEVVPQRPHSGASV